MSGLSRSSPDFAPIVWSTSEGTRTPLSGYRPPESLAHTFSTGGMIDGPNRRKNLEREKDATTMRTPRVREATLGLWQIEFDMRNRGAHGRL
jgi:hypothetical protein